MQKTVPDLAAHILATMQIHDTGGPCLWAICKLDNDDKHNLLIPVVTVLELVGFSHTNDQGFVMENNRAIVDGTRRVRLWRPVKGPIRITNKGHAAALITLGPGHPLQGRPVIESLIAMAELTTQAVDALEAFRPKTP